jgi:signal transduction histidine kinase/streptogramin lyase/ActR/RegA family two-component response regulator
MSVTALAHASIPETPRFKALKVEDGLPSSQVNLIAQTKDGYLWFGTKDGLARFDGSQFKVYRRDLADMDGLPGNGISALHLDPQGRLWVGIDGHGLVRLDPGKEQFVHLSPDATPLPEDDIFAIESTTDRSTWFGTYRKGLYRLSASGTWTHFSTSSPGAFRLPSDEVLALAVDEQGALFAGTGKGLVRWSGVKFETESTGDLLEPRVVMLQSDSEGLWIGSTDGLRVRTQDGQIKVPAWQFGLTHPVFATTLDRFGVRWLSTSTGLMKVKGGVLARVEVGAPHGLAFGKTLLEDAEGGIWVAQRGFGVLYTPASWRKFSTFGPNSNIESGHVSWIRTFAESRDGDIWLAGVGGLDKFHPATGAITPRLPPEAIRGCNAVSLLEGTDGVVWIGCLDGLIRFDPVANRLERWSERSKKDALPHGPVASIVEEHGRVWINTGEGIQGRNQSGKVFYQASLKELGLHEMDSRSLVGPDSNIWFDSGTGIQRLRLVGSIIEPIPGLPTGPTRVFGFGRAGVVWVLRDQTLEGYRWDGHRMILDRRIDHLGELVGVSALLVDRSDRIWLTTARGLVRVDPSDTSVRVYDTEDGLPSPEFDAAVPLVTRDGLVYASTPSDFVVFDPNAFESSANIPKVQLDSITLRRDDAIVDIPNTTTRIVLGAEDRDLRITARIASLSEPRSRRFRFRLDGYDRDWIEDHEGERVFTRLEHGTYVMEVAAATADGVWSTPRRLEIVVLPRWWQTVPARVAFAIAFLGLVLVARAAYRARLREQHEKQSLEERRALAEQASQAKSRFLADLGHEIRTPMTGVLGMAELMHADASDERQRGRIEAIQSAGRHLLVLLNDALDLARIEAGRLELQDVAFDLPALLVDACALLRPQAEAKRLAFALQLPPDLPRGVRGDPVRLRQILLNLGHNAVKFTTAGRIRICASAVGDTLHIDVEDTGPGMDAAQVLRLFGRFEQADGARTSAAFGGSGLGLSICRELAQAMHGDIEVDSAPGQGTRFRVTLPLVPQALPEPASLALRVREPDGEGARVLVVEDDALVGEVVCGLLEHLGHRARHAAHGLEGLAAFAEEHFDLVVVDLDLPGIDGFELARLLQLHGRTAPIVALTARADAEAEARVRDAGMVAFLRKPVTGEVLAAMVARHARRSAPQPA